MKGLLLLLGFEGGASKAVSMRDALLELLKSVLRPLKVSSERAQRVLLWLIYCHILCLVKDLLVTLLALDADDVGFEGETLQVEGLVLRSLLVTHKVRVTVYISDHALDLDLGGHWTRTVE